MYQKEPEQTQNKLELDAVSDTLASIYTGVFLIDLINDRYSTIKGTKTIGKIIYGITSAQQALNTAIAKTVGKDELVDMLSFVNLATLPARMQQEKVLNIEYKGVISGWVRGSFMEVKRDADGRLAQVLYTYQVIDEQKRKELDHLKMLKEKYARSELENQKNRKKTAALEADKQGLTDDLQYHNDFNNLVMEQMNCGLLVYTIPGRTLLEINKEALRIFGWKDKEEASKNLCEKLGRDREKVTLADSVHEMQLLKLREVENLVKYKFTVKDEKNEEKLILGESKSLSGRYGGKIIISTLTDITNVRNLEADKVFLKDANTELQRARDAVQIILKSGSYICAYKEDGESLISIKFSDALRRLYGYSTEDEVPDTWETWLNGAYQDDRDKVEKSYLAALKDRTGNTDYDVTYRAVRKDGSIRWYKAAAYIIRREDGTAEFSYGLIMDVDEQKRAADQIEEALYQAERANAAKTSFLSSMSHDIRTPMNGIMGLIEINERHADDVEFTSKNRKKAKVAATHLLSLINEVLQLSKLEDPVVELSHEPFNLLELSEDILTITEQRAKEKNITVKREDDPSLLEYPYVYGSALHVKQIFINLLGNSIKYNKENGSIFCHASMEKKAEDQVVYKVTIRDTGIGMSEEFQKRLFEPFAREQEEDRFEGTGLGMSIVKQLIDKMHGTIQVNSIQDVGSSFTVEIPFTLAARDDVKGNEDETELKDISGSHILLVEDNELNRDIAEIILTDVGAKITKAVNGQQALDIFEENAPGTFDAILMDVQMPVINGYEATRKIRNLNRKDAKTVPIIAITANAFTEDVELALQAGMNDHLAKPLNIQKMINVIAKYVN